MFQQKTLHANAHAHAHAHHARAHAYAHVYASVYAYLYAYLYVYEYVHVCEYEVSTVKCQDPTDGELMEALVEAPSCADVQTVQYASTKGRKTNRPILSLFPTRFSLRIAGDEQVYQVTRTITERSGTCCFPNPQTSTGTHNAQRHSTTQHNTEHATQKRSEAKRREGKGREGKRRGEERRGEMKEMKRRDERE